MRIGFELVLQRIERLEENLTYAAVRASAVAAVEVGFPGLLPHVVAEQVDGIGFECNRKPESTKAGVGAVVKALCERTTNACPAPRADRADIFDATTHEVQKDFLACASVPQGFVRRVVMVSLIEFPIHEKNNVSPRSIFEGAVYGNDFAFSLQTIEVKPRQRRASPDDKTRLLCP